MNAPSAVVAITQALEQHSLPPEAQAALLLGYCVGLRHVPDKDKQAAMRVLLDVLLRHPQGHKLSKLISTIVGQAIEAPRIIIAGDSNVKN